MNNFQHHDNIIWAVTDAGTVYGIAGTRITRIAAVLVVAGFVLSGIIIAPALAVVAPEVIIPQGTEPLAKDNPEMIAALKTHIAFVSQDQDARMKGIISYVDSISNGDGSTELRGIREDYLAVASSIPIMQTSDEIGEARLELQRQSVLFNEKTKAAVLSFNGNFTAMREKASSTVQAMDSSMTGLRDSLWLAKESSRLTIFNQSSNERAKIIRVLGSQGVDVSAAQELSDRIDAERIELQKALARRSVASLKESNSGLKSLNREFRATINGYRKDLTIEMKHAAILAMG